jgi:hypothetical protein
MILVYTLIFAQVMQSRLPGDTSRYGYSIYLCAGIFGWGLFAEITSRAQNMFIEQANLLKKISFPRICLPVIVLNALVNFAIIFGLFTVFLVLSGQFPGAVFLLLLPVLLLQVRWPSAWACARRAQCILPRRRPVLPDLYPVLVLAHAHRLPGQHPAAGSARPAGLEPDGGVIQSYQTSVSGRRRTGRAAAAGRRAGPAAVRAGPAPVPQTRRRNGG